MFDFYEIQTQIYNGYIIATYFILVGHKRAEIQSREVNKELWIKNGYMYYVTVTLTFDPGLPISIESEQVQ